MTVEERVAWAEREGLEVPAGTRGMMAAAGGVRGEGHCPLCKSGKGGEGEKKGTEKDPQGVRGAVLSALGCKGMSQWTLSAPLPSMASGTGVVLPRARVMGVLSAGDPAEPESACIEPALPPPRG